MVFQGVKSKDGFHIFIRDTIDRDTIYSISELWSNDKKITWMYLEVNDYEDGILSDFVYVIQAMTSISSIYFKRCSADVIVGCSEIIEKKIRHLCIEDCLFNSEQYMKLEDRIEKARLLESIDFSNETEGHILSLMKGVLKNGNITSIKLKYINPQIIHGMLFNNIKLKTLSVYSKNAENFHNTSYICDRNRVLNDMKYVSQWIFDVSLGLYFFRLPVYVLLEIIDKLPIGTDNTEALYLVNRYIKVRMIEKIYGSFDKILLNRIR